MSANVWPKAYDDMWEQDLIAIRARHKRAAAVIEGLRAEGMGTDGSVTMTHELVCEVLELWRESAPAGEEDDGIQQIRELAWETFALFKQQAPEEGFELTREAVTGMIEASQRLQINRVRIQSAEPAALVPMDSLDSALYWVAMKRCGGDLREAMAGLAVAQEKWGRTGRLHAERAQVLWALGKSEKAFNEMAMAAAYDQTGGWYPLPMAGWYLKTGDRKSAGEAIDEALRRIAAWLRQPRRNGCYRMKKSFRPKGIDDARSCEMSSLIGEVHQAIVLVKEMEVDPEIRLASLEKPKARILSIRRTLERHLRQEQKRKSHSRPVRKGRTP
jgi:hypothetical protein